MNAQQIEPWRLQCPNGDRGYQLRHGESAESRVYCNICQRRGDDPHHDHLIDAKTGEEIDP